MKESKKGYSITRIGSKEIKEQNEGRKKIKEAFPISMLDPRHSRKIMA